MPRKKGQGREGDDQLQGSSGAGFHLQIRVVNRTAVHWWAETGRSVTLDQGASSERSRVDLGSPADRTKWPAARRDAPAACDSPTAPSSDRPGSRSGRPTTRSSAPSSPPSSSDPARRSSPSARCWPRSAGSASAATRRGAATRIAAGTVPDLYRFTLEDGEPQEHVDRGRADREGAGATGGDPQGLGVPQDPQPRRPRADPAQRADPPLDPLPLRAQGRSASSSEPWRRPGPTGASRSRNSGSITPPLPDLRASLAAA